MKIALIGAAGYEYRSSEARIDCFSWDRLNKVGNLADYDIVILNLLSLGDPGNLDAVAFRKMLDVRTAQEVLGKENGSILILGDPRFNLEWRTSEALYSEPFLAWTGIEFSWDDRSGDTVERSYEAREGVFKPFADKLTRWNYSLAWCRPDEQEYAKVWNVKVMQARLEFPLPGPGLRPRLRSTTPELH